MRLRESPSCRHWQQHDWTHARHRPIGSLSTSDSMRQLTGSLGNVVHSKCFMNKMPLCAYLTDFCVDTVNYVINWVHECKYPACFSLLIHFVKNLYYFSKAIFLHFSGKQEIVKMPRRTRKTRTITGKNARILNKKNVLLPMCLNLVLYTIFNTSIFSTNF